MKKWLSLLLSVSFLLGLCACTGWGNAPQPSAPTDPTEPTDPSAPTDPTDPTEPEEGCSILFIGNSHTYYNSMWNNIFVNIVRSAGYENVTVNAITAGGAKFSDFLAGNRLSNELAQWKYDYVVMQEQLARPILNPQLFYESAAQIVAMVKAANPNAQVILYQVWGGAAGNIKLNETGCKTPQEINYRLAAANTWLAEKLTQEYLPTRVAYSGLAFLEIEKAGIPVELYDPDGYHPSYAGSFLSAMTIFSTIFREDPASVTWQGISGEISDELLKQYQAAVDTVVFHTPEIDPMYAPNVS